MKTKTFAISVVAATIALLVAGRTATGQSAQYESELKAIAANLEMFDDLDFNVFSGQKWAELHRSHSHDVIVHWPDGRTTHGIDQHIEDLKAMFVWAPDTRIKEHPIKLGQGDWTAVIGYMEGTFTEPMPTGDGNFIEPTGKAFRIRMATFSRWTESGPMDEEYLFWDNQEFMRQIGLGE